VTLNDKKHRAASLRQLSFLFFKVGEMPDWGYVGVYVRNSSYL